MNAVALGPALRSAPGRGPAVRAVAAPVAPPVSRRAALPLGLGLSGLWHGTALALAVTAGIFQAGSGAGPVPVAEVSLMPQAAFDAMISAAPDIAAAPPPAPPPAPEADTADAPVVPEIGPVAALVPDRPDASAPDAAMPVQAAPPPALRPPQRAAPVAEPARQPAPPDVVKPKPEAPVKQAAAQPAPDAASGSGTTPRKAAPATGGTAAAGNQTGLMADWGARLRGKVDRARRYPSGAEGATGRVTLRLTVAVSGQVLAVKVRASSGHAALDRAALDAVRRAGRLPKAPKGLGQDSYSFNLPVVFTR